MSTTELMLKTTLEGRVLRTLQAYFRSPNDVLVRESLWANGLSEEQVDVTMNLLQQNLTVSEIMEQLREKGFFA
ncbi:MULTISPECIES: hypothetical protein [Bacillales]|jgi:hypothetical protein|uniref:ArsR family transcriptional regulator n=1 Tax=Brevibacillus aydinogluensis TaxID=927786 RepID=A0AA48RBN0_9BACL|nr:MULTISPECIES: hypothetical protein [Bacillales]REK61660.1 MAG: hypothetical protein DF221_14630 [Brevibacillus sp.]MBR8660256.1 hypothetical protein [Brevibacillus sp. NL20B1]MDT3416703.1 hypothetical protein [Brevibacillus aydinogluensis]NNV04093.1 hypothetical protein [Brevibacillus sp. MCWH]UFJ61354.1 hypothetical protein IRT44_00265 [Anoxybacillus sediminis]